MRRALSPRGVVQVRSRAGLDSGGPVRCGVEHRRDGRGGQERVVLRQWLVPAATVELGGKAPLKRYASAGPALDERAEARASPLQTQQDRRRSSLPGCPSARHDGQDKAILAERRDPYIPVRNLNPARWSGATRDCSPAGPVTVNPKRDSAVAVHLDSINSQPLAA